MSILLKFGMQVYDGTPEAVFLDKTENDRRDAQPQVAMQFN